MLINKDLELMRFIAAILILLHHSYLFAKRQYFIGAWVFVEVFFMWSGYFLTKHFSGSKKNDEIIRLSFVYTVRKAKKILPYAYMGILLGFLIALFKYKTLKVLISLPFNFIFLSGTLFLKENKLLNFNNPLWYLSHLFILFPFIIYFKLKLPKIYKYFLCWFLPLILYCWILKKYGTICLWDLSFFQFTRSVAALLLGSLIYYLCCFLKKYYYRYMPLKIIVDYLKYFFWFLLLCFSIFSLDSHLYYSLEMVSLSFICNIFLFLSDVSLVKGEFFNKFVIYLGSLSLPIYCLHYPLMIGLSYFGSFLSCKTKIILSLILVLIFSILTKFIVFRFNNAIKKVTFKHLC